MELMDTFLESGHLQFEDVPRPTEVEVPDWVEVSPTTIEVSPTTIEFNPDTAGGSPAYNCAEVVELMPAGTEELDIAFEVGPSWRPGPSAGEDTALVHV